MGAVHFSIDRALLGFLKSHLPLKLFVETGTFKGDSLRIATEFFDECHSAEMSPEYFRAAQEAFRDASGVHLYQGTSPEMLKGHRDQFAAQPVVFWLDAHWCVAENTAGEESQSPLLEEIDAIGTLHPESVVLIDDARLFLCAPPKPHRIADWPDLQSIVEKLFSLSGEHTVSVCNDVIIYSPKAIQEQVRQFAHENGVDWQSVIAASRKWEKKKSRFRFLKRR